MQYSVIFIWLSNGLEQKDLLILCQRRQDHWLIIFFGQSYFIQSVGIGCISRQFSIEIYERHLTKALADGGNRGWRKLIEIPIKEIGTSQKVALYRAPAVLLSGKSFLRRRSTVLKTKKKSWRIRKNRKLLTVECLKNLLHCPVFRKIQVFFSHNELG